MESGELKRRFGMTVQRLREANGLTQEQLADRIGRSVDTVSNIERGVNATRIEVAYQLSVELGVEMPQLFDFADRPAPPKPPDTLVRATVADLIADCDEATAEHLLNLVRVGLKLTGMR